MITQTIYMLILWNQICTFGHCERTMELQQTFATHTQCMIRKQQREAETEKTYDCIQTRSWVINISD